MAHETEHEAEDFKLEDLNQATADPTTMNTWYPDTPPFVVLRFFAKEEISNDEIKAALLANSVTSLCWEN